MAPLESFGKNETAKEIQQDTREKLDTLKKEVQDTQTTKYFEKIAKEPGNSSMSGLINMRDFGMKTVEAHEKRIQADPQFENSGNKEQIFEAYTQVQAQFDNELNAIHAQNLNPEEYGKAMNEALRSFEANLESAAKTANGLLHGTLAKKAEEDSKTLENQNTLNSQKKEPAFQEALQKHIQDSEAKRRVEMVLGNERADSVVKQNAHTEMAVGMADIFPGAKNTL